MGHRKQDDDTGVSEMKAFGEELIATGARYIEAGKRWLDARLDDSTSQRRAREQDGGRSRPGREYDPYRRGRGDHGPDRGAWSGGGASRSGMHEHDDDHGTGHGHAFWDEPPRGSAPEPGAGPWRQEQRWQPREPHSAGGDGYGAYGSERLRGSDDHLSDWGHRARPGQGSGRHGGHGRHTDAARHGNAAGGWRGVGPKGYVRSDARITEDICERLLYDDAIDAREISVQVRNGVVSLEGHVPGRAMKHRVEDLVERCAGVRDIENHLRVQRADRTGQHDAPHDDSLHTGTPGAHAPDTNVPRSPSEHTSSAPSLTGSATGLNAPGAAASSGSVSGSGSDNGGDAPDDDGNPHRV